MEEEDLGSMDDTIKSLLRGDEAPEPEKEPEAQVDTEKQERDEKGKFVKPEDSAASETPSTPSPDAPEAQAEAAEPALTTTTGKAIDLNRAPASWKPAAKAQWTGLPEPIRQEIYRRESDYLNGSKAIKENADFGQSIRNTVEPYRMLIEAEGGTPERAISDLLRTAAIFRVGSPQQKLQALMAVDQQFNVGLVQAIQQQLTSQQSGQAPAFQQFQDPRVDQILTNMQAQQRATEERETAISNAAAERFLSAADESGQPRFPFVDNVLDDMTHRVSALRAANPSASHEEILERAYDEAVWANPETRMVLQQQQQAKQQASEETLRRAEAAKRASRLNLPKRGSLPAGKATGKMEDTILETYRQLTS